MPACFCLHLWSFDVPSIKHLYLNNYKYRPGTSEALWLCYNFSQYEFQTIDTLEWKRRARDLGFARQSSSEYSGLIAGYSLIYKKCTG